MVKFSTEHSFNKAILDRIKTSAKVNSVEIGYPEGAVYPNGQKVADVAMKQEYGTPRIPPRPFIRPTVTSRGKHWFRKVRDGYAFAKKDTEGKLTDTFENLGKAVVVNIQQAIDKVTTPPLSEYTIMKRKKRGNNSTKPLVDTRKMRDSLSYRVGEGDWKK